MKSGQGFQKLYHEQDRQTDRHTQTRPNALIVVIEMYWWTSCSIVIHENRDFARKLAHLKQFIGQWLDAFHIFIAGEFVWRQSLTGAFLTLSLSQLFLIFMFNIMIYLYRPTVIFSSAGWAGQMLSVCLSRVHVHICLNVNHGGTNSNRCTRTCRLVISHAQTY